MPFQGVIILNVKGNTTILGNFGAESGAGSTLTLQTHLAGPLTGAHGGRCRLWALPEQGTNKAAGLLTGWTPRRAARGAGMWTQSL